ncbi:hypothetical protein [Salinicoccus halitifaciens]|uniref:Holin n=1 Tax=Salinicoccus halitifaciens TaxID=1073415 RepID=A0ABV2E8L9_9STAP|nr:hypothetical protein [Salinicoccus halitifaciens]MCD2137878.1 hypothetical protein [Salinicoccus halitifaciens]
MKRLLKKYIPIGLTMFAITLTSRVTLNDGNFELSHILTATIMAIVMMLTTAFFDSHPMNKEEK